MRLTLTNEWNPTVDEFVVGAKRTGKPESVFGNLTAAEVLATARECGIRVEDGRLMLGVDALPDLALGIARRAGHVADERTT